MKTLEHKQHSLRLNSCSAVVVSQVFLGKNTEAIIYFWLKDS